MARVATFLFSISLVSKWCGTFYKLSLPCSSSFVACRNYTRAWWFPWCHF